MTSDLTFWPPAAPSHTNVQEDRCAADPAAPMKHWVYKAPAIGFVLSGWFDYLADGRTQLAAPGAVVFGNRDESFCVRHHDADGNKRMVVLLKQATLDGVANDFGLDEPRFRTLVAPPGREATRMYAWMRAIALSGAEDCEIALAQAALRAPVVADRAASIGVRERTRALIAARHIEAHFTEPCGLSTLAAIANASRYQLVRAFTAIMGQSPIQFLINVRVRAAADRLRTSRAPITDIAFDVGFNDISHFYYCFKSALGVTPRRWRLGCEPQQRPRFPPPTAV